MFWPRRRRTFSEFQFTPAAHLFSSPSLLNSQPLFLRLFNTFLWLFSKDEGKWTTICTLSQLGCCYCCYCPSSVHRLLWTFNGKHAHISQDRTRPSLSFPLHPVRLCDGCRQPINHERTNFCLLRRELLSFSPLLLLLLNSSSSHNC